jgi:hypothetical protein
MPIDDVLPPFDSKGFAVTLRNRTWDWLAGLRRPLNADIQLVDKHYTPGVPEMPGSVPGEIARLISAGSPALRVLVAATIRTRTTQHALIDGLQIACCAVTPPGVETGALVLARAPGQWTKTADQTRAALEGITLWLCPAVEAHLSSSPPLEAEGLGKLSSLGLLLAAAAARGSDRETVAEFAEVLAVWHDLDTYGYVETANGDFVPEVMLAGIDPATVPATIDKRVLPFTLESSRLVKADGETLGFATSDDVHIARVSLSNSGSWLLLLSGPIAPEHTSRIRLFITLLEHWVAHAAAASVARVVTTMSKPLLEADQQSDASGSRALSELIRALPIQSATWTVATAEGASLLQLTAPAMLPAGTRSVDVIRSREGTHAMTLAVSQREGRHITPQERQALQAAAELLQQWTEHVAVDDLRPSADRRVSSRRFDDVLERFARQALERGSAVAVIMLSAGEARPGLAHRWVRQLRTHLRPSDLVGMLADGDVGVLLHDTPSEQVQLVAGRLKRLLTSEDDVTSNVHPVLGVASWAPGDAVPDALVQQAREKAFHRHVA